MIRTFVRNAIFRLVRKSGYGIVDPTRLPVEATAAEASIVERVRPYTMTSVDRIWALLNAVRYVAQKPVEGAVVECGVWRGGSMMAAAMQLLNVGSVRDLFLFDTFAGMTQPTAVDKADDETALPKWRASQRETHNEWAFSPLDDVRRNMHSTGYPQERIRFIKGPVEATLLVKENLPDKIALLRLDTDWYESTKLELEVLFPRLIDGGILLIDDFGDWEGSQKATVEYFENNKVRLLLNKVDRAGRICLKV